MTSARLLGKRWKLTTTGHTFLVTARNTHKVEVLEGRTTRWLPSELLLDAYRAGILVEIK